MKTAWKQKLLREATEYGLIATYLFLYFGLFSWYRGIILAEHQISYFYHGVALVKSLVLAKVILIGNAIHLGHRAEGRRLIVPTLFKSLAFGILVGVFAVLETSLRGLFHGQGPSAGIHELLGYGRYELLARCVITFFAFIPFFAFQELGSFMGEGKIMTLFFRKPEKS
ncbi:MAG: hypothetical protein U1F66_10870 [bacterium]